jgi:amino acid permease
MADPSAEGANFVMTRALCAAALLFFSFGLVGYLFAYDQTSDNILNNFLSNEPGLGLLVARVGLMVTLMCQLPMIMLPCRQALFSLLWPLQADAVRGEGDYYVVRELTCSFLSFDLFDSSCCCSRYSSDLSRLRCVLLRSSTLYLLRLLCACFALALRLLYACFALALRLLSISRGFASLCFALLRFASLCFALCLRLDLVCIPV